MIGVEEPGKAGFKLFQKCKKGALAKVPVLLVTASVSPENFAKHRGLKTPADEYVDKRTMTVDELVGKIDNLIGLGDPVEEEISIPVEEDIPMDFADGDVVLDETVGDDGAGEFSLDMQTAGHGEGVAALPLVDAETEAAFASLLGDDEPAPAAHAHAPSAPPIEVAHEHAHADAHADAIPEPVPHVMDRHEQEAPVSLPGVPAVIEDGGHPEPEHLREELVEHAVEHAVEHQVEHAVEHQVEHAARAVDSAPAAAPTPLDEPLAGVVDDDFSMEEPVTQYSGGIAEEPHGYESSPAIPISDEELVSLDDELPLEVMDESDAAPAAAPMHAAATTISAPPSAPPPHEEPPAPAPVEPAVAEAPSRSRFIDSATTVEPSAHVAAASPGSGAHPAVDLGLDAVASDAESEQSGIYDRRALRKIHELERQLGQL
jgi:hypothetical protein